MQERLDYIDAAKAVAIISVVMGHVLLYDLYGGAYIGKSPLMGVLASYHNYLFVFLSGMVSVTAIDKAKVLPDMYKRFRCFIVPALVVGIPYAYCTGADFITFITNSWKWGYWYLFVLFALYVVCYPFALLSNKQMKWVYVFIFPVWLFIYRHTYPIPQVVNDTLDIDFVVKFFPYFFVGSIIKRHKLHDKLFTLPILGICLAITFLQNYIYDITGRYLVEYLITFSEVLAIVTICKYMLKKGRWGMLLFIGRSTLYIYLFHYIAIQMMCLPAANNWFAENAEMIIDFLVTIGPTIIAIGFCLAAKWILEKSSIIQKWVFYKR